MTEMVGVLDAARIVGVSPQTIRNRIASGDLPAYKAGSNPRAPMRILTADLLELLKPVEPAAAANARAVEVEYR